MEFAIGIIVSGYASRKNTEDGPIEVWIETHGVQAQDETGRRWVLVGSFYQDEAKAHEVLASLDADFTPVTQPDAWEETDPMYGSEAWDVDAERSLASFEADCYGEPRPSW